MSTQVQRRKGTTVQHSTFTGASAELTVDTTKNTVVVHNGATAGGIPLAKETGSALSATSLSLPNSTTNGVAYVNGSKVVVAGSTFTFDGTNLSVNGITVGKGAGSSSFNTAVGELALGANTSSATNTAVGYNAMKAITTGSGNTAVGAVALTLASDTGNNTAIGRGALFPSTGTGNTALGYNAGGSMSSGSKNVIIGSFSGNDISYGTGLDIRTLSNYVVLSDGDANPRAWWNGANPTFPGVLTLSDGTANGVPYLNGSKQITTGSALTFDGTNFAAPRTQITTAGSPPASGAGLEIIGGTSPLLFAYNRGTSAYLPLNATASAFGWSLSGSDAMILTSSGLEVKQSQLIGYSSYAGIGTNGLAVAGNVGIGTSSPGDKIHAAAAVAAGLSLQATGTGGSTWRILSTDNSASLGGGYLGFNNGSYRMVLDSAGNLLVGQTSVGVQNTNGFSLNPTGASLSQNHLDGTASGTVYTYFGYNGSIIGSVSQAGTTGVLYNVTSDQRLKENIVDAPEFGSVIDSIKVRSYDWKTDQTHQRAGFIAQELVAVVPEAVHQPTNPEEMMAVDYSKLVPMLVKEIQDLRKRLATLEAK